jgi:hypothetical protein
MSAFTWCSGMGIGGWLAMIALWVAFLGFAIWAITRIFPVSRESHLPGPRTNQTTAATRGPLTRDPLAGRGYPGRGRQQGNPGPLTPGATAEGAPRRRCPVHANHLKHMLLGGAAILAALVLAGVPLATAASYALVLACPLMMIFMMRGMIHGGSSEPHHHADDSFRDHEDATQSLVREPPSSQAREGDRPA